MSDFWGLSDGGSAADTGTDFEIPSGNLDPIPDGSTVLALIDEAKWDEKDGAAFVSLRWSVLAPDEFKNRKVFQKLWVMDDDPMAKSSDAAAKKRDKARRMLSAIDANAGGKLVKSGAPTDDTMTQHLTNKPMVIKCMEWSMPDRESPGEFIRGNWIAAVGQKTNELHAAKAKSSPKPSGGGYSAPSGPSVDDMDEIPF
jgi:hypothetical protein